MSEIVKQSFENLIKDIKKNPHKATANFEATALLRDKLVVKGATRQFEFEFDEPKVLGGDDSAPNPVEYVLATLGACQAITYKALASLKGIQLDKVTIKTRGNVDLQGFLGLDNKVRPGFQNVGFETIIESSEDIEKILRLSKQVESLCPVLDIISNPVEVKSKLSIKNKRGVVVADLIKQSVEKLAKEIEKSPNNAKVSFDSTSVLKDRVSVKSTVRQFTFHADEAEITGGVDSAPNPLEYLLASLGACQAITYKALASSRGIQLNSIEVKVKGYTDLKGFLGLDKVTRPGYLKVDVDTVIESEEDPLILDELYKQVEAVCPVLDIFSNANEVKGKLTVQNNAELVV